MYLAVAGLVVEVSGVLLVLVMVQACIGVSFALFPDSVPDVAVAVTIIRSLSCLVLSSLDFLFCGLVTLLLMLITCFSASSAVLVAYPATAIAAPRAAILTFDVVLSRSIRTKPSGSSSKIAGWQS